MKITLNGKEYPFRKVMGAMIALKRTYGCEVDQIGTDTEKLTFLIYSYVKCTCANDKVTFDYSFEEFSNAITLEDMADIQVQLEKELENLDSESGQKKS